jgi:hypothetical protein
MNIMDSRLKKSLNAGGRETRASEDASRAAPEEKFMSAQERRKMWSDEWTQSALPKLPELPGWHLCWLSTTNSYDSIDKRIRLGYVPVKTEEIPGFENFRVKAGEHAGFIACNEMLLFKIPMDMYQDIMLQMHHEKPMEESEKIRVQLENLQGARDSTGRSLGRVEGEGFGEIERSVPTPVFHG